MKNSIHRQWGVGIAAALVALLAACSGSDGVDAQEKPASEETTSSSDEATGGGEALTVENLGDHCDDLTEIVVALRGEEPEEIEASDPMNVTGDHEYRTSHCTYAYEGDSFSDKNRVDIYFDGAGADPAHIHELWGELSTTSQISGVGDDATWYSNDAFELKSTARALVGDLIISVRVTVPEGNEGAPYLSQDAVVTALESVVATV